jgi:hypothetical protein
MRNQDAYPVFFLLFLVPNNLAPATPSRVTNARLIVLERKTSTIVGEAEVVFEIESAATLAFMGEALKSFFLWREMWIVFSKPTVDDPSSLVPVQILGQQRLLPLHEIETNWLKQKEKCDREQHRRFRFLLVLPELVSQLPRLPLHCRVSDVGA